MRSISDLYLICCDRSICPCNYGCKLMCSDCECKVMRFILTPGVKVWIRIRVYTTAALWIKVSMNQVVSLVTRIFWYRVRRSCSLLPKLTNNEKSKYTSRSNLHLYVYAWLQSKIDKYAWSSISGTWILFIKRYAMNNKIHVAFAYVYIDVKHRK